MITFTYVDKITLEEQSIKLYYNVGRSEALHKDYAFVAIYPGYRYEVDPMTHVSRKELNRKPVDDVFYPFTAYADYLEHIGNYPAIFDQQLFFSSEYIKPHGRDVINHNLKVISEYMMAGTMEAHSMYEYYGRYLEGFDLESEHMQRLEGIQGRTMLSGFAHRYAIRMLKILEQSHSHDTVTVDDPTASSSI